MGRDLTPKGSDKLREKSEARHTPGPWAVKGEFVFAKLDGEPLAEIYEANEPYSTKANAHLIKAAPNLLKSLERMVQFFADNNWTEDDHDFLLQCKNDIKKAKGE